jgi:hypothetical protein
MKISIPESKIMNNMKRINEFEAIFCPEDCHFIDYNEAKIGDYYWDKVARKWSLIVQNPIFIYHLLANFNFCRKNINTINFEDSLKIFYIGKKFIIDNSKTIHTITNIVHKFNESFYVEYEGEYGIYSVIVDKVKIIKE